MRVGQPTLTSSTRSTRVSAVVGPLTTAASLPSASMTNVEGIALGEMIPMIRDSIAQRLPGPDVTPAQLRERNWWRGPELFLLVDDYDLVALPGNNPLAPLTDLLPQARDVGLHLIITRRAGGVARALYESMIQRLRELDSPGLLMSGNRDEGPVFGDLRPSHQPPGRGTLVRRSDGRQLVQTAWPDPT